MLPAGIPGADHPITMVMIRTVTGGIGPVVVCCLCLLLLIQPIPVRFPDPLPAIPAGAQESVPGDNRQMTELRRHIVLPGYI